MRVVRPRPSHRVGSLRALICGTAALLVGCHGSSISPPGTPVITLGDTSGDFASYIVSIDSMTFKRNDGNVASVLASPLIIDLARYTDMTELMEAPALPSGTYTSATLVLDYTSASVWVNVNGKPVAASVVNSSGALPTALLVTVTFDPQHPLVITHPASTRVHIDVDLAASNTITTTSSSATVTVQPFLVITPAPVDTTVMRARGVFVTVPSGANYYIMNLRPFYSLLTALGAVFVNTNAQTYFNVEGVTYTGAAGLAALAQLTENTPLAAYGTLADLSGITPTFNATAVYAGTSLESPLAEYLTGVVSARSNDTLTLLGASYRTPTGVSSFLASLPVLLGSNTLVGEDGVATSGLTIAAISVGQQINVSGQITVNSSGVATELDATAGNVRLQPTRLWGTLNSAAAGSASLDVLTFANFTSDNFSFTGTGPGGQAATAAAYGINTGALDESAVAPGTLLQVDGMVTPFGGAPPDFTATAITPGSATAQELVIEWVNGGATQPFISDGLAGIVVDPKNADLGSTHYLRTGPVKVDLSTLPAFPLITTVGAEQSKLQLAVGSTTLTTGMSVFNSAAGFASALATTFNGTNKIYRLVASGQYDSASNTFVATRIHVALHE